MIRSLAKAMLIGCVLLAILSLAMRVHFLGAQQFEPIGRWIAGGGHEFSAQVNGDLLTLHHIYGAPQGTSVHLSVGRISLEKQIIEILRVNDNGWKTYRPATPRAAIAVSGGAGSLAAGSGLRGMTRLRIPLTVFPVAFCIPPIFAYVVHRVFRRKGRADAQSCRLCGYNLTGNTSGRCPECGRCIDGDGRRRTPGS